MWGSPNSQEVGLEAATLERVRNSSLVEGPRADNGPGLKPPTEAVDSCFGGSGRGAFGHGEGAPGRGPGVRRSANAGMSSDQVRAKRIRRKPEVSDARSIRVGLVGPKPQAQAAGDGQSVDSLIPRRPVEGRGTRRQASRVALEMPGGSGGGAIPPVIRSRRGDPRATGWAEATRKAPGGGAR